jgi:hypothetical protein
MRRRKVLVALVLAGVMLVGLAAFLTWPCADRITQENFETLVYQVFDSCTGIPFHSLVRYFPSFPHHTTRSYAALATPFLAWKFQTGARGQKKHSFASQ